MHPQIEALVRDTVTSKAQEIAAGRYADDVHGTEDAINAQLGLSKIQDTVHYSSITAAITLAYPDEQDIANARKFRDSIAQIERLRFLKDHLFSDPSMLLLDYIDRNPGKLADIPDLASFQHLALKVSNGDRWWCQVLHVLEVLSAEVSDEKGNLWAMTVLLNALKEAAPDLFSPLAERGPLPPSDP